MLRGLPQLTLSPGQRLRTGRQRAPYALHSSSLQLLYVTWGPCAVGLVDNGVIRTTSRNFKRSFSRNKKTQLLPHCEKTQHFHPPLLPPPSPPTWRRWRRRTAVATGGDGGGDGRRRRDGRRWLRRRTAATDAVATDGVEACGKQRGGGGCRWQRWQRRHRRRLQLLLLLLLLRRVPGAAEAAPGVSI